MILGFVIGAQCNATCEHCGKGYGPTRREALSTDRIVRLMSEAALIADGEPLCFAITGGEPFVRFESLVEIVTHAARLGAEVTCVTNAFWATTDELTVAKLAILRDSGLTELAISVSRFHQRFVPLRRVRRALETAVALGIATTLKGAVTKPDLQPGGELAEWKEHLDADEIEIFPVLPYVREGVALPEDVYYRVPGLPENRCPSEILNVDFNGVARSCCSPGRDDTFLGLGHIDSTPLAEINRRFLQQRKQQILREIGPIAFARAAIAAGLGHHLRDAYAGPCDLCLHVRTDPALRRVADELSATAVDLDAGAARNGDAPLGTID